MLFARNKPSPLAAIPLTRQDIEVLFSAVEFKQQLLTLIAQASQRIYLCALYLQNDDAGQQILTALYQAKQQNPQLDIKVFVDYHRALRGLIGHQKSATNRDGYLAFAKQYAQTIKVYGVPVKRKELFGVLHLKGFVIDDTVLYSGASVNNVYLQQEDKYRLDRYHLINSKSLAQSFVDYLDRLTLVAQLPLINQPELPTPVQLKWVIKQIALALKQHYQYPNSGDIAELSVRPLVGCGAKANQLNSTIRKLLRGSQHTIVMFTPYFNLPKMLLVEIKTALAKGVAVTIVVGDKRANDFYIAESEPFSTIGVIPYIYEQVLRRFVTRFHTAIETGQLSIHVWHHHHHSFHLKGLVVDEQYHLLTGNNLNPRAWRLDLENGLLIHDPKQQLQPMWQQELTNILAHTQRISGAADLQRIADYPTAPRKLLTKLRFSQITRLLQRLL